jgi:hypothetical protein
MTRQHMLGHREITRTTNNTNVGTSMIERYMHGIVPHAPDAGADNQPSDCITDGVHMETDAQVIVDGEADELPHDMSLSEYNIYQNCQERAKKAYRDVAGDIPLDKPPNSIIDIYSSVLGYGFHVIDLPKIPTWHDSKKPYKVAFQEAVFAWDPGMMLEAEERLRGDGMGTKEIEAKKYFNAKFFRERVEQSQVGASTLYWRARAVFVVYGGRIDPKSNLPLFNKAAWEKANKFFKEILLGLQSDPPGLQLYHPQLNAKGEPAKDKLVFQLIERDRGTNNVESGHRINRDTFCTRHTGIESSDSLSAKNTTSPQPTCIGKTPRWVSKGWSL